MLPRLCLLTCVLLGSGLSAIAHAKPFLIPVGAAKVDITPKVPVRLSGYGNRRVEATEAAQRIWAKALAIGDEHTGGRAILLTAENCGVTPAIRDEVARQLADSIQLPNERLAISVSHSHTAPCLTNWAPFLFGMDLPADHQQHVDQYTQTLTDKLVEVAKIAARNQRPATLGWAQGRVGFAINRRVLQEGVWKGFGEQQDGPVDHSLPILAARDADGKLIAVVANYACHCTTLGGDFNQVAGDWAGYAQEYIEQDHPGAIALITIGTGADANPSPRGGLDVCQRHGRALADEVKRLLAGDLTPLHSPATCELAHIELPFDALPTREQLSERSKQSGAPGYHAQKFLARLEAGETLPSTLRYPVATWTFGRELAIVFLGGEVVVDYGIRLKEEFDDSRLWITAYTNDVPCYIASKRILREGGYEADYSMIYYARPTRLAGEAEDIIVDAVQKLLPHDYYSASKLEQFPGPLDPEEALASIQVPEGFRVELVAAEPLIADPVAFDWGPDGRLWVVEMHDYPNGLGWKLGDSELGRPGGRVRTLSDTDGDGRYDQSTIFLDELPFPTGIKVWRDGVLITAAPEVLFAKDTDGDGRADQQETLYVGFGEGNQQHRVNGLRWGVDNWLYLGNGDSGGKVKSLKTDEAIEIRGRDLRIRPDTGALETQSGQTQFGRTQDNWGNWFGGNNSAPMWHYVLDDHYLRRNPYAIPPDVRKHISQQPGAAPVFPASRTLARFNDFDRANRFTSACSPILYRDRWLGEAFVGNSFVCEPVHNLVHREIVWADGVTFASRRADSETASEFFASSDNWCRPSMVRTGPDGALWISDMYRAVIEHPTWIPAEWQRKLDLRAGDDRGRIYRIVPIDATPTKPPRLDSLDTDGLVAALDSPNGWQRDMAQQMLLWRSDPESLKPLARMTNECDNPLARLHALYTLDGLRHPLPDSLPIELLLAALNDPHPGVRRHAVRLAERRWDESPQVLDVIVRLADDSDPPVRLQVAYSLGESSDPRAAEALARLALRSVDDAYTKAAVMSSVTSENIGPMIATVLKQDAATGRERLLAPLLAQAAIRRSNDAMNQAFAALLDEQFTTFPASRVAALLTVFDAVATQKISLDDLMTAQLRERLDRLHDLSAETVANEQASESDRALAVRLLAARPVDRDETLARLASLLSPRNASSLQSAAIAALAKLGHPRTPELLLADWQSHTPTTRSEIFDALLDQAAWTEPLLAALQQGRVLPSQLDARRRQRLLDHRQSAVRDRAAKLLATSSSSSRQTVLDQYAAALKLPADAARGKQVFAKRCSACHQLEGVGHVTGPDLLGLTDKSPGAMLVAMMDPNRAVEDKFLDYVALLSDGRTISGMLAGETGASLTLVAADGKRFELARSDLEQLRSTGKSLMPEGLERDLTPQDVADVIAYVRGVSQPAKKFDGNEPKPAAVRDDGSIRLLATDCRIYGPRLVFESQYRNLGYWQSEEDRAVWNLDIRKAGRFRVSLDYACDASAAGDRFLLTIAGQTLGGQVPSTGSWNNYQSLTIGDLDLPAGPAEATMRSDGPIRNALLDLRTIRLIPVEK